MTKDNWHTQPRTLIFILVFIFGLGVAWASLSGRVLGIEDNQESMWNSIGRHRAKDGHAGTNERLIELETHMGYVRKNVDEIKDIVKDNARLIGQIEQKRD